MADTSPVTISSLLGLLSKGGGIAYSNTYKVTFQNGAKIDGGGANAHNMLLQRWQAILGSDFSITDLSGDTVGNSKPGNYVSLMCDEATLPGVQSATGQVNGIHTGSGQFQYPHTRIYNDLSLSWICDANMTPLKFLQCWMEVMYNEYDEKGTSYNSFNQTSASDVQSRSRNRSVRLNYPDEYTMQLSILKAEKNKNSELGRPSIRYVFDGVYPYAIDTIPLSYGTSQLVKVSANFYYERWFPYYDDAWNPSNSPV